MFTRYHTGATCAHVGQVDLKPFEKMVPRSGETDAETKVDYLDVISMLANFEFQCALTRY